jgi:hypothetical protein
MKRPSTKSPHGLQYGGNPHHVEQADIFKYQSYSHSDDMFIILRSNTDTSIFVFSPEKSHDSKYSKCASPKHSYKTGELPTLMFVV